MIGILYEKKRGNTFNNIHSVFPSLLAKLSKEYNLKHFITTGHGSGVVFVGDDIDMNNDGTTLPMIDYEQIVPKDLDSAYKKLAGDFFCFIKVFIKLLYNSILLSLIIFSFTLNSFDNSSL